MKFFILCLLSLVLGEPKPRIPTLATLPEKLRLYQNATGMSDGSVLDLFKRSLAGDFSNDHH